MYIGEEASSIIGFLEWLASIWGLVCFLGFSPFCFFWAALHTPCVLSGFFGNICCAYLLKKKKKVF